VCALFALAAVAEIGSYGEFLNVGRLKHNGIAHLCNAGRNIAVRHNRGAINRTVWRIKLWMKRLPQSIWKSLPAT
jgi:hypothetical protein